MINKDVVTLQKQNGIHVGKRDATIKSAVPVLVDHSNDKKDSADRKKNSLKMHKTDIEAAAKSEEVVEKRKVED